MADRVANRIRGLSDITKIINKNLYIARVSAIFKKPCQQRP